MCPNLPFVMTWTHLVSLWNRFSLWWFVLMTRLCPLSLQKSFSFVLFIVLRVTSFIFTIFSQCCLSLDVISFSFVISLLGETHSKPGKDVFLWDVCQHRAAAYLWFFDSHHVHMYDLAHTWAVLPRGVFKEVMKLVRVWAFRYTGSGFMALSLRDTAVWRQCDCCYLAFCHSWTLALTVWKCLQLHRQTLVLHDVAGESYKQMLVVLFFIHGLARYQSACPVFVCEYHTSTHSVLALYLWASSCGDVQIFGTWVCKQCQALRLLLWQPPVHTGAVVTCWLALSVLNRSCSAIEIHDAQLTLVPAFSLQSRLPPAGQR